jgi:hypothetical protein
MVGGERELEFQVLQNPGNPARMRVLLTYGGRMIVSNGDGVTSAITATWDGVDVGGVAPGLNFDVTKDGHYSEFVFNVTGNDLGIDATLRVEDNAGGVATLQQTIFGTGEKIFPFSGFSPSIDFTDVKSITYLGTGIPALDYTIADFFIR